MKIILTSQFPWMFLGVSWWFQIEIWELLLKFEKIGSQPRTTKHVMESYYYLRYSNPVNGEKS